MMASEFGSASLFIDGCPGLASCYQPGNPPTSLGPIDICYPVDSPSCVPCNGSSVDSYRELCNHLFEICDETCFAG